MAETQPIRRSPADVLRLVVAAVIVVVLLLIEWIAGDTLVTFGSELLRGLDAIPQWIVDVVVIGTRLLALVVVVGGMAALVAGRRWRAVGTVAAAGALAWVLFVLLDGVVEPEPGGDAIAVDTGLGFLSSRGFVAAVAVAVVAAGLTAAAPWLSRRWRRAGWVLVSGLAILTFGNAPVSFDAATATAVGWLSGAAVLVAVGAPSRRPTTQAVIDGLGAVGLPLQELEPLAVDARGSTPYIGVGTDGTKVFVKALGVDERSADLLFRAYRALLPRNFGDERPFDSLRRAVEHEAFVALSAAALGIRTPPVLAVATAEPGGYVLAYGAIEGRSLDRLDPSELTDELLDAIWALLGQLRRHRVAHRDLRLANIFLDDAGAVWMIDFGFSEVAASDLLLANDVAEFVASSSLYVGAERAIDRARASVDPWTLGHAAARLQPWSLAGATRTAMKGRPGLLDSLRAGLSVAASAPSTTGAPR